MKNKGWQILVMSLALISLATGCRRDSGYIENAAVPRLFVEMRGGGFGGDRSMPIRMASGAVINVVSEPVLSELDIANVEMVQVELGRALLVQAAEPLGTRRLYRASVQAQGNRMVLLVNNLPIGSRRIDGPIDDGNYFTFTELNDDDLEDLVLNIKETLIEIRKRK